jgi:hypothetical protein
MHAVHVGLRQQSTYRTSRHLLVVLVGSVNKPEKQITAYILVALTLRPPPAAAAAARLAAEQVVAHGLFGLFHFPIMLNSALERYM